MRLTIRRDLLTIPTDRLRRMADAARDQSQDALAELARLADSAPLGDFVDAYERHALAVRRVAQLHTAIAIRYAGRRPQKGGKHERA